MARDETIKLSLIDGVTRTLGQIREGVSGVGASLTKLNQGAELAAKGFAALGSVASGIGDSVSAVADLELALARVSDITQATTAEQAALQQAVSDAATQVGVTADQAANALLLMAEDGFSASEAVGSLNAVLSFAKANAQDAATATQALGGVLDTFGEKPQIIAQLADQLTAASRAAGVGTTTLQQGLAAIGVQAEQAGLGVSDAIAALAALASRGIEGTQAAKQLGTVLTQLNDPASKAGKALDDAGLAGKSFGEIVAVLSKDSTKAAEVLESLGARPRAALKVLLAEGGGALRDFGLIVDEAAGASERAAAAIDETFKGAVSRLQAAIGNLRNEFLSPILQPLADEAVALAEKINALGDSPQFARIRDQFQELATNAIRSVGDLIEKADLEEWAGDVADFASDAKRVFDALVLVVETTASTIRGIGSAIDYVRTKAQELDAYFSDTAASTNNFNVAAQGAERSLRGLGAQFERGTKTTRQAAQATDDAAKAADDFAGSADRAGSAAAAVAEDLRLVPPAAKLTVGTLGDTARAAELAGLSLDQLQKKLAQVRDDLGRAAPGSPEFQALAKEAAALEAQIAKTKAQIDDAASSTDRLARSAESTSSSLRNFASAAGDAGDAADDLKSSNSQVADSFGNIGNKSSETAISLGNLSEAFVRQALEAAGAAKSAKDYIDTLNRFFAAGADQEEKIKARLDQLSRQNVALSEEEQIRKRLALQYGTSSTLLDELVRKELELARAKKQANDETKRSIQIEAQRTAGFGGVGTGQQAEATGGATGGRGSSGGGGDRGAPQIVINVQGMTTDQARQFVEQSVVPELERINRLSR